LFGSIAFIAVVAQREAVSRALRQHLECELGIEPDAANQRERFGERDHVLEQHHVVHQLHRLGLRPARRSA